MTLAIPIFFRASVYALAAACFGAVCRIALGADLEPFTVFCLTWSGYLMGSLGGME